MSEQSCMTCQLSIGMDKATARFNISVGWSRGLGEFKDGVGLACVLRRTVLPTVCPRYEREAGSDD